MAWRETHGVGDTRGNTSVCIEHWEGGVLGTTRAEPGKKARPD